MQVWPLREGNSRTVSQAQPHLRRLPSFLTLRPEILDVGGHQDVRALRVTARSVCL